MSNRPLKYGTNVIYNGTIYKIKSISKTDNVNIESLSDNTIISVNKSQLIPTPLDQGELIKYKDLYYIIKEIKIDNNKVKFRINFINESNNNIIIQSNDDNIIKIEKKIQGKIISFLKFIDRYNNTISYLNKKQNQFFERLDHKNTDEYINDIFDKCQLRMNQLNAIVNVLKKTQSPYLQFKYIYTNPFGFISQEFQLITYERAEIICDKYKLNIDFKIKIEKWTYDLFLKKKNTFYILQWIYLRDLKNFCERRNQNHTKFLSYIDTIIINKKIGKDNIYKTTEFLLNVEKSMTDLMIKLFNEQNFDIPENEIIEKIEEYEDKVRKIPKKEDFSLEEEQKRSVINSVQNKLSIITGPPGTGKTEILKCINFVLYSLYKDEYSEEDDDEDDDEEDDDEEECEQDENNLVYNNDDKIKLINPKTVGLTAPTGLAFVNMHRSIENKYYNNKISGTCHKNLYHTISNIKKHKNKKDCDCESHKKCKYKLSIKLMEIDEVSMLDTFMFYDILKECEYFNSRLILLGDEDQLPSIGPGQVLNQLIKTDDFTVTKLTKIKRQANGTALVNNIIKMRTKIITITDFTDDSMQLIDIETFIMNSQINEEQIVKLIKDNNLDRDKTKFITYFNKDKYTFNTIILNIILQNIFNPLNEDWEYDKIPSNNKWENKFQFRVKDKIIRTENDYSDDEKMRANGEEASILDFDGMNVTVQYSGVNDKPEKIGVDELYENFQLNYCVTVHKSQGSQYENVVYFIEPKQTFIGKKSIYTAISRAKERCFIISNATDFVDIQKKVDQKVSLFMEESNEYNFSK
uniref:UvrD-like helicase C-terminal domain-containing protein n=1 Tax=viral metagenome TaxID=1070528 RepID=A0A6C0IFB5_9ZZZZ